METYVLIYLFALLFNWLLYALAYFFQTDKVTDISYALTFVAIGVYAFVDSGRMVIDGILLLLLVLWAIRLGVYLFYRVLRIGHDERFNEIRKNPLSFFVFWTLQGITCATVSLSYLGAMGKNGKEITSWFLMGIGIAILGLLLESIADYQKFIFKLKHADAFMNIGLWKTLRHPNYTGELLFWWGIFLACISYQNTLIALIGPLWITFLLVKVSGIPILEKQWEGKYGQDLSFQQYKENSWRLIPYIY
jgi:steroid 5-alpha reductase family enzyme